MPSLDGSSTGGLSMSTSNVDRPLQPGDLAPNIVLDAISREGKIALDDFRGRSPLLIGLFRGLHCPFCRRHVAAMAQLNPALREKGVQSLAVVNTPVERARLYFRYHPIPGLLAASDPVRASHRAFGLPEVGADAVMAILIDLPGELPEPMGVVEMDEFLNKKEGYDVTQADQQMMTSDQEQLVGQFLIDREGIIRWTFTEVLESGLQTFKTPNPEELMSAASQVAH
ncbi:peroxiredoxin [Sinorhizobium fredii]